MRYRIETHPNRDMRTVHVDAVLFSGHFGPHYRYSEYDKLGQDDRDLVDAIVAVPGVREVFFSAYQLSITRGGVFSWDEVLEPVLKVLERHYGGLEGLEEVPASCRNEEYD